MVKGISLFIQQLVHPLTVYIDSISVLKYKVYNHINSVMVSVFTSSSVDRGFEPRSDQTRHKIGICCFFTKHAALRRESKDWLALNQDNMSEWGDMSIHRLLFQ